MHRGYIKLFRKIADNDLWTHEKFTRGQAWVDLIMIANHKDSFIRKRGIKVEVKRGDVAWSERALAERWLWSRGKVRRFLSELCSGDDPFLVPQTVPQNKNVIASYYIKKYDEYQGNGTTDSTTNGTTNGTGTRMIKKYSPNSVEFRLSKYLYGHILQNNPKHKEPNYDVWSASFDKILRIDKRNVDEVKAVIRWCQKDPFWFKNILSPDKLRKQYDALLIKMEIPKPQKKVKYIPLPE